MTDRDFRQNTVSF